jgi:RNA polymerase sigma factor (sigma-70 family)
VDEQELASEFEENRPRLRAVAYRILGSLGDADDALQEAWLRASRARGDRVERASAWLATVVARVCLNMLPTRRTRREDSLQAGLPDPVVTAPGALQSEEQALLADSLGMALLIVLDRLPPAERLAFVLHDTFEFSFEEIAPLVGRTPQAARQLASRGRRRVREAALPEPEADVRRQREVVDAFFRAARGGDLEALLKVLHPDVVLRSDFGATRAPVAPVLRGAAVIAEQARLGALPHTIVHPVLVNGSAGALVTALGRPFALLGFIVVEGRIVAIDAIVDAKRLRRLTAAINVES